MANAIPFSPGFSLPLFFLFYLSPSLVFPAPSLSHTLHTFGLLTPLCGLCSNCRLNQFGLFHFSLVIVSAGNIIWCLLIVWRK
ncbi:hypothetical protein FKM82_018426 [Ascaphus truei]